MHLNLRGGELGEEVKAARLQRLLTPDDLLHVRIVQQHEVAVSGTSASEIDGAPPGADCTHDGEIGKLSASWMHGERAKEVRDATAIVCSRVCACVAHT